MNQGGQLKKDHDEWISTGNPISDYSTLIRNLILVRLTYEGGFKIR